MQLRDALDDRQPQAGCVVGKDEYRKSRRALGVAYREIMGRHYPAMTAVQVAALGEEGAKVEIEATAVIPDDDQ